MSGSCSASSVQELAGYSRVRPGSLQGVTPCSKSNDIMMITIGGREVVQESVVEPPVAADNMKREVASTATNILCLFCYFQINGSSLTGPN